MIAFIPFLANTQIMPCRRSILAGAVFASLTPRLTWAQTASVKALRIVVPYPPGGPTDALARLVANELQTELKRTVTVENKPGASGAVGTREVARSEPDGTTLVLGTNQTHVTNAVLLKEPGYSPAEDFKPVAGLADLQHVLVVPKNGAKDVEDLIARAKASPGQLNYGSSGVGSASHLGMELLLARSGTRMTHVAFRGAAPMALEILAGRIDCAMATLPSVLGQIEAGEMRALALASSQRAPQLANLILLREAGITGGESDAWLALFAPKATPDAVVEALGGAISAIMGRANVKEAAFKLGLAVNVRSGAAFAGYLKDETRKWLDVIRQAGVKPE